MVDACDPVSIGFVEAVGPHWAWSVCEIDRFSRSDDVGWVARLMCRLVPTLHAEVASSKAMASGPRNSESRDLMALIVFTFQADTLRGLPPGVLRSSYGTPCKR